MTMTSTNSYLFVYHTVFWQSYKNYGSLLIIIMNRDYQTLATRLSILFMVYQMCQNTGTARSLSQMIDIPKYMNSVFPNV